MINCWNFQNSKIFARQKRDNEKMLVFEEMHREGQCCCKDSQIIILYFALYTKHSAEIKRIKESSLIFIMQSVLFPLVRSTMQKQHFQLCNHHVPVYRITWLCHCIIATWRRVKDDIIEGRPRACDVVVRISNSFRKHYYVKIIVISSFKKSKLRSRKQTL